MILTPLPRWNARVRKVRSDLEDALSGEEFPLVDQLQGQRRFLASSFGRFRECER
jgi:hypothetical protein